MANQQPLLLSFSDAAAMLGISRALLYQLHSDGRLGPLPHKLGRRSLFRADEIQSWVAHNMPPRMQWEKIWNG